MASGSPRARIDQFYTSKKRKSLPVKDANAIREPRSTPDGSPSGKATLEGYLVKSPDTGKITGSSSAYSRLDPLKRNLSLEICTYNKPALIPCSSKSVPSAKDNEAVPNEPSSDDVDAPFMEPSKNNSELQKFANDFLSLYCSDFPTTSNLPQESKGQKRTISPSSLIKCSKGDKKKPCIVDPDESILDAGDHSSNEAGLTDTRADFSQEHHEKTSFVPLEGVYDDIHAGTPSTKKSSTTPNYILIKTGLSSSGALIGATCFANTPKSSCRSSMFSPGEEFWNEAIQVADGIFSPKKKLLIQVGDVHCSKDVHVESSMRSVESMKKVVNTMSSVATQADGKSTLTDHEVKSRDKALLQFREKQKVENREFPAEQQKHIFPLLVKHFDFEEGNLVENHSRVVLADKATSMCRKLADGNSLNGKHLLNASTLKHEAASALNVSENSECLYPSSSIVMLPPTLVNAAQTAPDEGKITVSNTVAKTSLFKEEAVKSGLLSEEEEIRRGAISCAAYSECNTPSSSLLKDQLQLTNWLPSQICSIYIKKGISKLYPWQVDCLLVDGVLEKKNLVYCASTSAGKSFVAEILMLRRVIMTGRMALLVLPYVSICSEKAEHLEQLLEPLGKHVRSFYGSQGGGTLPKDTSVAVCTIEKANSLLNRLLEDGRLSELGIIVIDELHMVGDQHRGYLLELMLTKLRYAAGEGTPESPSGQSSGSSSGKTDPGHGLQIVGMSATMPNVAAVADWLQAALYQTDFRPVPLEEYIKVGNTIFDKAMNVVRTFTKTANVGGKDPDHIVELCNEVVQEGHSVLLFCSSRKGCESTARHVAKFLKPFEAAKHDPACEFSDATSAVEALKKCPVGLDPVLEETLPFGVAYHHAGLTVEEREIIETCYRKGVVRVLTATSTLAAGVNLPARRVIFRQPKIGRDFIDGTRYRQMAGRAGRTGIDTKGESILVCKPEEVKRVACILNDSCPPLHSCLAEDKNGMTHAILEVVSGGIVQTANDIHRYVRCTLLNSTKPFEDVVKSAQDSLRWLCHKKFLEWNEETKLYSTTPLGRASFGSSLTPEEALIVLDDLLRAREGFVLASDLHLVYLVTPINVEVEPDWELYYERFMQLSSLEQSVGNRVGVSEPFLMRMAHGAPASFQERLMGKKNGQHSYITRRSTVADNVLHSPDQTLRVSKRFFVALMLSRLVQEVPVSDVCEAFRVARGMIQALQENAGRFAMMVAQFCERLGWQDMEGLVAKFQNRVSFGVRAEIVELTNIPYVKGSRARALYKAGFRTTIAIAEAPVSEIAKALFETSSWAGQENSALRGMQLGIAKKIKNGARKIVLDQAEEARVAAFATFKSLGVQVPQGSLTKVDHFHAQTGGKASSGDDVTSCFNSSESDNVVQHPALPLETERKMLVGTSQKVGTDLIGVTVDSSIESETRWLKLSHGIASAKVCGESSLMNNTAETSIVGNTQLLKVGASVSGSFDNDCRDQVHGLVKGSSFINSSVSDKGPINACNFPGGIDLFLDVWETVKQFSLDAHFTQRAENYSLVSYEVYGLAICWDSSPVYYLNLPRDLLSPTGHVHGDVSASSRNYEKDTEAVTGMFDAAKHRWNRIAKIMGQSGVWKFMWNLKVLIQVLKHPTISFQRLGRYGAEKKLLEGIEVADGSYFRLPSISVLDGIDVHLLAWILWPDEESKSSPNLEKLVKRRLSTEAAAAANRDGRWRNQIRKAAHNGCCRRVAQVRALSSVLWKLLDSEKLADVLTRIENPLVKVLADMELWGIGVDVEACLKARHILARKLKELENEAYHLAGTRFSLYSAADIANVLYTRLKLLVPDGHKKGKLHPSTNKHSLDLLRNQHPIISVIKEHRTLSKLLNSTIGSICSRARLCMISQKHIIQGHWLQGSTSTGRLSMEEPNLQCVEHAVAFTIRDSENSTDIKCCYQINARNYFIPTRESWLFVTADYSQIELRLMAHFSKDEELIGLLSRPDGDVFTMIASRWTGQPESTISHQERDQTKRLIYGILYGMGANTVADQLECSSEEAKGKIQSFKASFPRVSSWLHEAVELCRQKGFIETLMGRKRFLSKIKFGDSKEKAKAQRQAVNSICQGSAADIIKIAMVNIHSVIANGRDGFEAQVAAEEFSMLKDNCRIVLQVHDELVLEVEPSLVKQAGKLLQTTMESAVSILVPLPVKLKFGSTWGSLEPLQL